MVRTKPASILLFVVVISGAVWAQAPQIPFGTAAPALPAPPQPATPPDAPSTVHGRIVAAETGKPLHGARVRLHAFTNVQSRVAREAVTDRDGRYRLENLPPGGYSLRASHPGYIELHAGQKRPDDPARFWNVPPGQTQVIDFALPRGGVLIGRITDDAGEPLAGVSVTPLRLEYTFTGAQWRPAHTAPFVGATDDRGEFRVPGLMPGTYLVVGTLRGDAGSQGYAPSYYPGTPIQDEARRLTLALNEEVSASFSMTLTPLVRITGQVQSSMGEMLKDYRAMLRGELDGHRIMARIVDRSGTFEFRGVTPGVYALDVSAGSAGHPQSGNPLEFASVSIVVGNEDIDGLLITTGDGVTLSGRVVYEGTAAKAIAISYKPRISATYIDGPRGFFRPAAREDNGAIGDDGSFTITGTHGRVLISPDIPGWQLRAVMLDGVDITDVPYDTSRGGTNRLVIFVTDQKQEVTGRVVDRSGNAPAQYTVLAFPRNAKPGTVVRRSMTSGSYRNSDGTFRLMGLPPGEYYAAALASAPANAQFNVELHETLIPQATPFELSPGGTATIELTLIE